MLITTEGIVIRERFVGENDKYIDILTKQYGVIEISVKGAKKIVSKNASSTQLFNYSKFCFSKRGDRYYLNSSEPISAFYKICIDVDKYALACYFAEVLKYTIVSDDSSDNLLRLLLNCLHFLAESNRSIFLFKSIFEFRLMTEIGLMPNLVSCGNCYEYTSNKIYFFINEGIFLCEKCHNEVENKDIIKMSSSVLHIMRYIIYTDFEKLFNFKISDKVQSVLSVVTEKYLINHLNRSFKTLDFYNSLQVV